MAESEENIESSRVFRQMNGFSRDLLQNFMLGNQFPIKFEEKSNEDEEGGGEIELSLGLSLNGRFGVDPERAKKLVRSSSITNFMISNSRDENKAHRIPVTTYTPITRTCSLPTETEEEWRKRKELQSLRRMDAKRRRFEKLKNVSVVKDEVDLKENGQKLVSDNDNRNSEFLTAPNWVSGYVGKNHGIESKGGEKGTANWDSEGLPPRQPSSQGSIGSQGSGSSGISDFGSQLIQGTNNNTQVKSLTTIRSLPKQVEQKPLDTRVMTNGKYGGAVPQTQNPAAVADKEMLRNMMVDMPCVTTRGDGPNGKRVEGFLYRYKKGEEVRIVCVCHGCFLSPAEFVKHGGGGAVEHPLKHIVVSPTPLL